MTRPAWPAWKRREPDAELANELAGYFLQGSTLKIAAGRAGIPPGRLRQWLREGEANLEEIYEEERGHPNPYGMLYAMCAEATAAYLQLLVGEVTLPSDNEWRARSWLLERRDEDFNPAAKVDVHQSGTVQLAIEHDDATLLRILADAGVIAPALVEPPADRVLPALPNGEADSGPARSASPEQTQAV